MSTRCLVSELSTCYHKVTRCICHVHTSLLVVRVYWWKIIRTGIPYNGNHPRKKSFTNYLLCHSLQENLRDSGNLIYKILAEVKSARKHSWMHASRFAKFTNFFPQTIPIIRYITSTLVCVYTSYLSLLYYCQSGHVIKHVIQ